MLSTVPLPGGLAKKGCTPTFDEHTLPDSLQREHVLPAGRWGLLRVFGGGVWFVDEATGAETRVVAQEPLVIEPGKPHHLRTDGPLSLRVEFYELED